MLSAKNLTLDQEYWQFYTIFLLKDDKYAYGKANPSSGQSNLIPLAKQLPLLLPTCYVEDDKGREYQWSDHWIQPDLSHGNHSLIHVQQTWRLYPPGTLISDR